MENMYSIHPFYSNGVKITDWEYRNQAYPFDRPPSVKYAHYRSLGPNNNVHIPKTTTRESMEQGLTSKGNNLEHVESAKGKPRPMINFTSFPVIDTPARFAWTEKPKVDCDQFKPNSKAKMYLTTYKRSYIDHRKRPIKEPEVIPDIQEFYPLYNRIPKNDFEIAGPLAPFKFMDDHLLEPTPQKKLSNKLKQIRMVSYNPWLGVFR